MTPPSFTASGDLVLEPRLYRPDEVMRLLGLDNRVQFWRVYERAQPKPVLVLGPRLIRLFPEAVRALWDFYVVKCAADFKRIADARRRA